ncbi:Glutamine-dependent NAD(+) synthetase [Thalassocella blandensis]|nr:Glutamine-dependent NAD(+) synthetase [Thalassocella blandensis]
MSTLNIVMAQINPLVGDIDGNKDLILNSAKQAITRYGADVVVFPELTLTGYPPEDLLLRPSLEKRIAAALSALCEANLDCYLVFGYTKKATPNPYGPSLFNMAGVIHKGALICEYAKHCLPNYQVFDEKRYFVPGSEMPTFQVGGVTIGMSICEDIWEGAPLGELKKAGIDLLLNLNASPYHQNKQAIRETLIQQRTQELDASILYVNQVGGQDELVFDGGSMAWDAQGVMVARSPLFEADLKAVTYEIEQKRLVAKPVSQPAIADIDSPLATIYQALVLGVKDYVNKNGFNGVVLGLSGGIDSALTLAVAVDALGPERVQAVMMPFRYTSEMSKTDAEQEAIWLGVPYHTISIENIYESFTSSLAEMFANHKVDTTEENIQARSRGVLLMAISNKLGYLVLTTGNKSEMSVGYATLYGDMAGGLDVLKDVPKTTVFELAKYRNTLSRVIPETVITRPPSAELAPDQKDEDSLPDYPTLDAILELYVEQDFSHAEIVAQGYDADIVRRVIRLVDINEYKRRQAPIGIRISEKAFGRDRRYPITNGWKIGE